MIAVYRKVIIGSTLLVESSGESTVYLSPVEESFSAAPRNMPSLESVPEDSVHSSDKRNADIYNRVFLSITNVSEDDFNDAVTIFINPYEKWGDEFKISVSDFWNVSEHIEPYSGHTFWRLEPRSNLYRCKPGETMSVLFDGIVCRGDHEKMVCIGLQIESGEWPMGYIPVFQKYHPVECRRFVCNRNTAGIMDRVTLEWEALGCCDRCSLLPGYGELGATKVGAKGSLTRYILEDTSFALLMQRNRETAYAKSAVTVLTPHIVSFKANKTNINYGTEVVLSFCLKNTYHAYIDNGIGRVEAETVQKDGTVTGAIKVVPQKKSTTYKLSVLGTDEIFEAEETVTIYRFLTESSLSFRRSYQDKTYRYDVMWKVENCNKILLTTSHGLVCCDKQYNGQSYAEGNYTFVYAGSDKLRLHVELFGDYNQKKDYWKDCN